MQIQCQNKLLSKWIKMSVNNDNKIAFINKKVLHLVKKKGLYPYEHISGLAKFKVVFPSREKFLSSMTSYKNKS